MKYMQNLTRVYVSILSTSCHPLTRPNQASNAKAFNLKQLFILLSKIVPLFVSKTFTVQRAIFLRRTQLN